MSAGFVNGVLQTNLTGLVYANSITNPASSVAYNTNVFSPTIGGSLTTGTTTYSVQNGQFTKIGNRLFFDIEIIFTATTGTGDLQVQNLPFQANDSNSSLAVAAVDGIQWPTNQESYIVAKVVSASTYLVLTCFDPTNPPGNIQMPSGTGSYTINVSGSYQTES